jgi:hypothetical protein
MKTVDVILSEFQKDYDNLSIVNDTLRDKYIKGMLAEILISPDLLDEDKKKYTGTEQDIITRIEKRDDWVATVQAKLGRLQEDILKGYRVITTTKGKFVIKFPTVIDDEEIDSICSRKYNELLADGMWLTEEETIEHLDRRKVYSRKDEERLKELEELYEDISIRVNSERTKDTKKIVLEKLRDLEERRTNIKSEYDKLIAKRQKYMGSTIESKIEELKLREKLVRCIYDTKEESGEEKIGERLWKSAEDLTEPGLKPFVIEVFNIAQYYWAGVDPSLLTEPPSRKSKGETKKTS